MENWMSSGTSTTWARDDKRETELITTPRCSMSEHSKGKCDSQVRLEQKS
jgi:hypothetical protein